MICDKESLYSGSGAAKGQVGWHTTNLLLVLKNNIYKKEIYLTEM
jgi:hypothetical protein